MPESASTPGPRPTGPPRVLVTGIGLDAGLGPGRETTWRNIQESRSAARALHLPTAPGTPPYHGFPVYHSDHRPREILFKAAIEAFDDSGLQGAAIDRDRVATIIGMSKGDLNDQARIHGQIREGRLVKLGPSLHWLYSWPDGQASRIARVYNLRGPCLAPVAACATGVVAVLQAADLIRRGVCDIALAGSGDSSLEPLLLASYRKMKALARVDGDPAAAVRPWSKDRSGFLVGEGAAVLVLEREDHARARGVLPYAEVAGGALGADAYHMTDLNPDPANLAGLIGRALENADTGPEEIDHVNVHGTATRANDPLECRAIRLALGRHADRVACSANKAQIGHLLGAAGSAELALTCLAIRDGFVPPTLNLTDPDPACDLDGTPLVGRSLPIRAALKLSLGFGGHLAVAVLRRPDGPRREGPG